MTQRCREQIVLPHSRLKQKQSGLIVEFSSRGGSEAQFVGKLIGSDAAAEYLYQGQRAIVGVKLLGRLEPTVGRDVRDSQAAIQFIGNLGLNPADL